MSDVATPRWDVGQALVAFGRQLAKASSGFTHADFCSWCSRVGADSKAGHEALERLKTLGMVQRVPVVRRKGQPAPTQWFYALTSPGIEAARVAVAETQQTLRAQAQPSAATRNTVTPFGARVWALLRARRMITAVEAANVLMDACDEATFDRARTQAGRWLLAWSRNHPEHVQISQSRRQGSVLYVLVQDLGVEPPPDRMRRLRRPQAVTA
jgi:hypothetical protein